MTTKFITSKDGTRIAYDVTGEGPALMLLHGAGKTRKDWHKTGYIARLSQDFTVINVDIRGSGESDTPDQITDYAIETIAAELAQIVDACEVDRYRIWGFSFGGNIAKYLAAHSPRVQAVVVGGVSFGTAVPPEFDRYIDSFIKKYGPLAEQMQNGTLPPAKSQSAIKGRIPVWIACFQAMRSWPDVNADQIPCPKMLVVGTKNRSAYEWAKEHHTKLSETGVKVAIFEGLTHSQEFSEIHLVFPEVLAFLKQN